MSTMNTIDTIWIDDSMWGFPVGGVLMGLYSEQKTRFDTQPVSVSAFQSPNFEKKAYLDEIGLAALELVRRIGAAPTDKIIVCRGYCNNGAARMLTEAGFTNVHRGVIKEPLQSLLEKAAKNYIENMGYNKYYDPKELGGKKEICMEFFRVIEWVEQGERYDIAKTGWKFWKKRGIGSGKVPQQK